MIILQNQGEIDIDVIKTMGVNIKDSENPIGYFGTGLKYAIAIFLREEKEITLYIGENKYEFFTESKSIRGKEFQFCKMRGEFDQVDLGFTTDLGRHWQLWQAYREIHSNCLDENGEIFKANFAKPAVGLTTFVIEEIPTNGIFLDSSKPIFQNYGIEIYEGQSDVIYYKGIRAKDLSKKSKYTYNVTRYCDLTEDRLLCYDFQIEYAINNAIAEMNDSGVIHDVITADKEWFESTLRMNHNTNSEPGPCFLKVYNDNKREVNSSVKEYVVNSAPTERLEPADRRVKFIEELENFCDSFDASVEDKGDYLEIKGLVLGE